MKRVREDQKGFGVVEGIVIVLVVAVLAVSGWWVWEKNKPESTNAAVDNGSSNTQNEQETDTTKQSESPTTFTSEYGGFSFTYPEGWKVVEQSPARDGSDTYIYITPPSYAADRNTNNLSAALIISANPDARIGEIADGTTEKLPNGLRLWIEGVDSSERSVNGDIFACPELAVVSNDGNHFSHPLPNGKNLALSASYCAGERDKTTLSYQDLVNSADWKALINIIRSITFK